MLIVSTEEVIERLEDHYDAIINIYSITNPKERETAPESVDYEAPFRNEDDLFLDLAFEMRHDSFMQTQFDFKKLKAAAYKQSLE